MKTFLDLVKEVQKPGLCHRCGGCVTFCTAINYGALELSAKGMPRYLDKDKCIECGLCYVICPEIEELREETRQRCSWKPPMGAVIETTMARARDEAVLRRATDGGVVTALLLHLFEKGKIDGAIVTRQTEEHRREPFLATSAEDILEAAGLSFDVSHGMKKFSEKYVTFSPIEEFNPMIRKGLQRVAMVGTPCQIKSIRKMQALDLAPSDSIKYCLGLFCSGNFTFNAKQREKLAKIIGFRWDQVKKVNIKEDLLIHLDTGETKRIPLDELEYMKRFACYFCTDYSAELADISFGGLGAPEGWTTVITRTPLGRAIFADARGEVLETPGKDKDAAFSSMVFKKVRAISKQKKETMILNRQLLEKRTPGA